MSEVPLYGGPLVKQCACLSPSKRVTQLSLHVFSLPLLSAAVLPPLPIYDHGVASATDLSTTPPPVWLLNAAGPVNSLKVDLLRRPKWISIGVLITLRP